MIQASFVMEQHLGHRTYYKNLRQYVDQQAMSGDDALKPSWVEITYFKPGGAYERLGFLPPSLRGALRGRAQVRAGLLPTRPAPAPSSPAVAFFFTQVPAVLGGRVTQRQPYVISTDITPIQYDHMSGPYGHLPDRPGPVSAYKHWVNRRVLRGAAAVLPWTNWTRQSLVADYGVPPERIELMPPGVDLELWEPSGGQVVPRSRSAADETFRILFVGGDMPRKGGDVLLEAYRALTSALPTPLQGQGGGAGIELHLVTRSAVQAGDGVVVHRGLLPNTPELISLFRSCDVFVLPSEAEAFGHAAVEAAAAGLPAIVTDVGGLPEIVVDGETGFVIRPGDTQALAAGLRALACEPDLRMRLGRAARARAEARFDGRRHAARVIEILRTAAASHATATCGKQREK